MNEFEVRDLGRMAYDACKAVQFEILEAVADGRRPSTLMLAEHDPVITLGAAFHSENLKLGEQEYMVRGIEVRPSERGGDVTYHGPGQLVAYPVFDLRVYGKDLHGWLRFLEETVLLLLAGFRIEGRRFPPYTGVWIGNEKVCAIGIKVRRWVSMHGLALNCDVDLAPFSTIVPCGIEGYGVTSISEVLGRRVGVEEVKPLLVEAFRSAQPAPRREQSSVE